MNLRIDKCTNKEEIESVLFEKGTKEFLFDQDINDLDLLSCNSIGVCFVGMYVDDKICGIAAVKKITDSECVVDLAIRKVYRGKVAIEICKLCVSFIFDKLCCDRILGMVRSENKKCVFFLKMLGFNMFKKSDNYFCFEFFNK